MRIIPGRLLRLKPEEALVPLYAANLLLIFHAFLVAYINSSFLGEYMPATAVSAVYTIGAALTVIIFLLVSRVLRRVGNYQLSMALLVANLVAVTGMAFAESLRTAVPLFLVHLVTLPLLVFNLDVFMERIIGNNEGVTGSRRGLLLTLMSIVGAVAPFIGTQLVDGAANQFTNAYLLSAAMLLPVIGILLTFFKHFSDPPYHEIRALAALRTFWKKPSIRSVLLAHFLLQVFFMFMVVYTPLYLTGEIGLSWQQFGIIMFFAQLAYVLIEYPAGVIADRYIGEREMMGFGFLIIALTVASFAFITSSLVVVWAAVMFATRVGASFVEVTTESYFFKQMKSSDAQVISFFRVTRPLAYVFGTLIAALALLYLPFNLLFLVLAALMVPALFLTLNIVDSK